MPDAFRFRSLRTLTGSLVLLQLLSFGIAPAAHADQLSGHLIIKQIDWAGSTNNPTDQWVELYNPTQQVVDLAQDPYTLTVGGAVVAALNSGAVTPMQSLLISRLNPADPASHSSLNASVNATVDPQLVLPMGDAQYVLSDTAKTSTDLANPAMGLPFAGSATASEQRVIDASGRYLPGDQSAAWMSSQTIGRNVAPGSQLQATPAENGAVAVATPTNVTITNAGSDRPTVMATFPAAYGFVRFINQTTGEAVQGVGDTVSGFQPAVPLHPGTYLVSVAAATAPDGDRSAAVQLPLSSTPQTNPTPSGTVQMPVLDPYAASTNKMTATLTGSVQAGTVSVSATANGTTVSEALNGMTTFSLTLPLQMNAGTAIQVVAVAADGSKSQPVTAQIMQSTIAPNLPAADHLTVQSNPAGTPDSVTGQPGAVQPGSRVSLYADQAMTQLIGTATAGNDGSFPAISLGDNRYATAYVVQTDLAGNTSAPLTIANPIDVANQNLNLPVQIQGITPSGVTIQLMPMTGVVQYLLKFRTADGQYGSPVMVCAIAAADCSLDKHLAGLQPGTNYVVAVAAVNAQGQMSNYTETSFQTAALPAVTVSTASAPAVSAPQATLPAPVAAPRVTATPTPAATASPSPTAMVMPSASPSATESGAVKSATTTARNWTPWIVLGVLIGLAILATAGYFYWFGGEAGASMDAAAAPVRPTPSGDASVNKNEADRPTKRW